MNISTFTTDHLRNTILKLIFNGQGITINTCGYDSQLCEITEDSSGKIEVNFAEEDKGFVDIQWSLHFNETCDGCGDGWTFRYQTFVESSNIKSYI